MSNTHPTEAAAPRPETDIRGYHAHIYYRNDAEKAEAAVLRSQLASRFEVELGRWRDHPVGPHPLPMYQVAFGTGTFADFVPWLMLNRRGLTVLVHPETGDDVPDHETHPLWLGERLDLNVDFLRQFDSA
jgi:DOPA 4,5-dioxygenase